MAQRYGWSLEYIRNMDLDDVLKLSVVYEEENKQAEKRKRAVERKSKGRKR